LDVSLVSNVPKAATAKLRIVHVFRAPLGGLFRHVVDLAGEQTARGHEVGLFFDSNGLCPRVEQALATIPGGLCLGIETAPIRRDPGASDLFALARFARWLRGVEPDIVHGHGSKGGAVARLTKVIGVSPHAVRAYTPHGGSFNYRPGSAAHALYMTAERLLAPLTDAFLFESGYIEGRFDAEVGARSQVRRVVLNGLRACEFAPVQPNGDAAEFVYVGELRAVKGLDTLLEAIARLGSRTPSPRLVLVGSGPEKDHLLELARRLGVLEHLTFAGAMLFRQAMALGRILVAPSRAESLPYVILEAAAARVPMIATDVGGIPEIFGPFRSRLGPSGDAGDLSRRMAEALDQDPSERAADAAELSQFVARRFTIESMADGVLSGYRDAISGRRGALPRAAAPLQSRAEAKT
jgi:glycosyltransferase involved in cell wall biosynthesis